MKRLKIGVFGAGRGVDIAKNFMLLNCDIVALCDSDDERREWGLKSLDKNVTSYSDFDKFIEHKMDAVIVANFFFDHARYVIKCFEKGIHVFCECISNGTMAEGVALLRAFEKTDSIFFLAENYPQMLFNREIKKVCDSKTLGKILYAEGEYNHPMNPKDAVFQKRFNYFAAHWRNYLPRTYYLTHSLGPIMNATGATPKRVAAFACYSPDTDDEIPTASNIGDAAAIIITQNDDGSVFRFTGCAGFGAHHNSYRVCGTNGQIENLRGMGNKVMLRYNSWQIPDGKEEISFYEPSFNDVSEEILRISGHGGSDYITARMFVECVEKNTQPQFPFDIMSAVNMSSVAILANRSMLEGGNLYDIPDLSSEEERKKYENDYSTPFVSADGKKPDIACCSNPDYKASRKQLENFNEFLKTAEKPAGR